MLVAFTATHGIHRGDLGIVAAWVLGVVAASAAAWGRPRADRDPQR